MHGGDRYKNTVKLDFSININPLGMPKQVKQAIYHGIAEMEYYPDPSCERLKRKIAKKRKVSEWNIILGNGACELIYAVIRAIAPSHVWIPIPSFTEYERALWNTNAKITWFPLKKEQDFSRKKRPFRCKNAHPDSGAPDGRNAPRPCPPCLSAASGHVPPCTRRPGPGHDMTFTFT